MSFKDVRHCCKFVKSLYKVRHSLCVNNNLLYRVSKTSKTIISNRLVINAIGLDVIFPCYHDLQCHLGEDRTVKTICERFYCPGLAGMIRDRVR